MDVPVNTLSGGGGSAEDGRLGGTAAGLSAAAATGLESELPDDVDAEVADFLNGSMDVLQGASGGALRATVAISRLRRKWRSDPTTPAAAVCPTQRCATPHTCYWSQSSLTAQICCQ